MDNKEDKILTIPNLISVFRILLIPVFIVLLLDNQNILAFLVFIIASISDGLDGFIARHFNQKSKLGVILDPIADRGLLLCGSIVLCIVGRLQPWIVVLVILRDFTFLAGGLYLLKNFNFRPKVIMLGKIATTFFYIGFAMLVLAWPFVGPGLNIIDVSWLQGFNNEVCFYGIYFVYIGIILNIYTSTHYIKAALKVFKEAKNA